MSRGGEGETLGSCFTVHEEDGFIVLQPKAGTTALVLDPGLAHVASCRSAISYIRGMDGRLFYRGRPIEEVAGSWTFLDTALDLVEPVASDEDRSAFYAVARDSLAALPEVREVVSAMPVDSHPMDVLAAGILAASACEARFLGPAPSFLDRAAYYIAQMHLCGALVHRKRRGDPWTESDDTAHPYMRRVFNRLIGDAADRSEARTDALEKVLILHAEHDQNCSTSTVRNIASAGGDLATALCAGIFAFKGPLHGGASERVSEMLDGILQAGADVADYVDGALARRERLMGFGHRVYRCWDPRARYMYDLLARESALFEDVRLMRAVALGLVDAVGRRDFFAQRKIFPNPDLFNGILFRWIGVPGAMNGVMLSMSRVAGWIAHYKEQLDDRLPIVRPRQLQKGD